MKNYIILITICLIIPFKGITQSHICKGDSVIITYPQVRGDAYWQKSFNGKDWSSFEEGVGDTVLLIPDQNTFYRVDVFEADCKVLHSSSIEINVVEIPEIILSDQDSVCINSEPVFLNGASPAGGTFTGPGIIDNYFYPDIVGAGEIEYQYVVQEALAGCVDSLSGVIIVNALPDIANAGEDQFDIMEDSIMLSAIRPEIGAGFWRIISGEGGTLRDSLDPNTILLRARESDNYVLAWTTVNSCGSYSDSVQLEFKETSINPCPGQSFVFDSDSNSYKTIQIGNQCWMAENLRVGTLVTSTIDTRPHSDAYDNGVIEVYGWKNNQDSLNYYGGLYDWDEMMNYSNEESSQGICPDGWHVPSKEDWRDLDDYFVTNDTGWALQLGGESGFNSLLSGNRNARGGFYSLGSSNFYWTSTTYSYQGANEGYFIMMVSCNENLRWDRINKKTGGSIRCIKNN